MSFEIRYAGLCIQGLARKNNEDNIWCLDHCLPIIHTDSERELSGMILSGAGGWFAVFDGMGGEKHGEMASYLSANAFGERVAGKKAAGKGKVRDRHDEASPADIARYLNRKVLDYSLKNRVGSMGSTAVTLHFGNDRVSGFNVGDSRCYRIREGRMEQLSCDHVIMRRGTQNRALTQCIGTPETEGLLEPYTYENDCEEGDLYLLCSDGLTSMVGDRRIEKVLNAHRTLKERLTELKDIVLKRGAVDNTSILLFEVGKKRSRMGRFLAGLLIRP